MIRINLSLDPSSWGSSATVEEAKTLAEILSSVICIECDKHGVDVIVSESNWADADSCEDGFEEDLLWAEGMLAGPWMEKALSEYQSVLAGKRVDARVAAGEHWLDAFNSEWSAETVSVFWGNCKSITLKREDARDLASARGPMDDLLAFLVSQEYINSQFETEFTADDVRSELKETGAWDAEELADDDTNRQRLLFVLSSQIEEFSSE